MSTQTEDLAHTLYTYTVEVKECSVVDVYLDFTEANAKNLQVVNAPSGLVKDTVQPFTSKLVAIVRAYDTEWTA